MIAPSSSIVLYAEFTALPGKRDTVAALIHQFGDRVRDEPGNVLFAVSTRAKQPDAFFVYEEYRDAAAFEAHIGAEHGAQFNASLAPLIVEVGSTLTWLHPV